MNYNVIAPYTVKLNVAKSFFNCTVWYVVSLLCTFATTHCHILRLLSYYLCIV